MTGNVLLRFFLAAALIVVTGCDAPADPPSAATKGDAKAFEVVSSDRETVSNATGQKWAIIVGVNLYLDGSIPSLKYAVADAEIIAITLVEKCGYDKDRILILTDAQPEHLKPLKMHLDVKIPRFLAKAAPGDTVFVFFSGHGFPDSEGQTYLAPKNCRRDSLALSALRVDEVSNWLRRCKAQRKLLVLDCCHAGGKDGVGIGSSSEQIGKAFKNAKGLITLASCKQKEISFEWEEKRHGLFTYFLVEGLSGAADKDRNRIVDSDEIYNYVYNKVPAQAERMANDQTPVRHIPPNTEGVFELARLDQPIETPDMAYRTLHCNILSGQWHLAWDQLPSSQQKDISNCIRLYADKMDPEVWRAIIGLGNKAQKIIKDKKDVILAWLFDEQGLKPDDLSMLSREWDSAVAVVSLTLGELRDLEKLKDPDVRGFLTGRWLKIREHLETLAAALPDEAREQLRKKRSQFLKAKISLIESNGDKAKIKIKIAGKDPEVVEMLKIDEKWLPADWVSNIAEAKQNAEKLQHLTSAKRIQTFLDLMRVLDSVLDQVHVVENKKDFDSYYEYTLIYFLEAFDVFIRELTVEDHHDINMNYCRVVVDAAHLQVQVPRLLRNGVRFLYIVNATNESLKQILPLKQQLVRLELTDASGFLDIFAFKGDSSPDVSDISPLAEFRNLKKLCLPASNTINKSSVDVIRKKLPKCKISWH